MKHGIFILLFFWLSGAIAQASPDLDAYVDIEGKRLFKDHLKQNVFYLSPSKPVLDQGPDGVPGVSLDIYRYLGRKGTGDSGKFWTKGVLSISIQREPAAARNRKIKKKLSAEYRIKYPRLKSIPVEKTDGRLVFADMNIAWSQDSRWSGKKIVVPLDTTKSQVLWKSLEAGQTLVSVEMTEHLSGVKKNKEKQWEDAVTAASFTLPITLDMASYPALFNKTDLGGRMVLGYTGIDVFCFDFLENLDENLYAKEVEIAIPTAGRPLVETVSFRREGRHRSRVEFKLAKDLDVPYKVRITKVYKDGTSQKGPWINKEGEAMLDVTEYRNLESDEEKNQ